MEFYMYACNLVDMFLKIHKMVGYVIRSKQKRYSKKAYYMRIRGTC
jgi:hypothetical protein